MPFRDIRFYRDLLRRIIPVPNSRDDELSDIFAYTTTVAALSNRYASN